MPVEKAIAGMMKMFVERGVKGEADFLVEIGCGPAAK